MGFDPFAIGDNNTKMTILSILDRLGPISAKKMHSELRKEGISISYQAAHKALNKMLDKGIIIYEDRNFSVNPKWVSNMRMFISQLEKEPGSVKEVFSRLDSLGYLKRCALFWVSYPRHKRQIFLCLVRRSNWLYGQLSKVC